MAMTLSSVMTGLANNPDVAAVALAFGFAAGYWKARSKFRNNMGMGGF